MIPMTPARRARVDRAVMRVYRIRVWKVRGASWSDLFRDAFLGRWMVACSLHAYTYRSLTWSNAMRAACAHARQKH